MNDLSARIQESNATEFNRYPSIFSIVREISIDRGKDCGIEVLSFGCSSGEEVASLDSIYLENSKLVGVDVSYSAIAKAKQYQPTGRNDCTFSIPANLTTAQILTLYLRCQFCVVGQKQRTWATYQACMRSLNFPSKLN